MTTFRQCRSDLSYNSVSKIQSASPNGYNGCVADLKEANKKLASDQGTSRMIRRFLALSRDASNANESEDMKM